MKERFETRKLTGKINVACKYDDGTVRYWSTDKYEVVQHIVFIVTQYQKQGYVLTLRQLHYQLVSRNWIINHDSAYKKLGDILDDCRYGGVIDWNAIEDRGRVPYLPYYNEDANDAMQDTINQFRIDRQENQPACIELWTEKDALSGILRRTTSKYHVNLVVNKGYTSSSAIYNAYKRAVKAITAGQKFVVLYFGDHDPSGLDMIRDIRDRLTFMLTNGTQLNTESFRSKMLEWWEENEHTIYTLIENDYAPEELIEIIRDRNDDEKLHDMFDAAQMKMYLDIHDLFEVIHIGLTKEQIKQYNLPPNPTKLTDSRAKEYVRQHGKTCWEVDALEPHVLTSIVEAHISEKIDADIYNTAIEREESELEILKSFLNK